MDTFYNTKDLSLTQKIELLRDCKEAGYTWWIDKLDCSVSTSRQHIDMDFEEVIKKFDYSAHFSVIDRKYSPSDAVKCFEIGFRTMGIVDYFLWIWVEDEKMQNILRKYNLQPR